MFPCDCNGAEYRTTYFEEEDVEEVRCMICGATLVGRKHAIANPLETTLLVDKCPLCESDLEINIANDDCGCTRTSREREIRTCQCGFAQTISTLIPRPNDDQMSLPWDVSPVPEKTHYDHV